MADTLAYVRSYYNMPWVGRGVAVLALGKPGVITSATHYINVRLDGEKHSRPYHPDDVKPQNSAVHGFAAPQQEPKG